MKDILSFLFISLRDIFGLRNYKPKSNVYHIKLALEWLKKAQDVTGNGGVSAYNSFLRGWAPSFVETTGYIIETFINCGDFFKDKELFERAEKMGHFLMRMQNKDGSFKSNRRDKHPIVFDTGQDIWGLLCLYRKNNSRKILERILKACSFLVKIQEKNGQWLKFSYGGKANTYDARTAWILLEVAETTGIEVFRKSALKNLEWVISNQLPNGWFLNANFPPPNPPYPFTHTISYIMEGLIGAYKVTGISKFLDSAQKTLDKLLMIYKKKGFLPATFDSEWSSNDSYTCLPGDAQIAIDWFNLYLYKGDKKYLLAARKINSFLKSVQEINTKNKNLYGGIKGSYPIFGDLLRNQGYCRMAFINWGAKFFIDSLLLEEKYDSWDLHTYC